MMVLLVKMLIERANLNSKNSSKPPSSDKKCSNPKDKSDTSNLTSGGQNEHKGTISELFDDPEDITDIPVDQSTLLSGNYKFIG